MEEYLVKRTFDVMDMFDELGDGDKKEFLHEAIRNLNYDDGYEVTKGAALMLEDYQQCKLIREVYDDIAEEGFKEGAEWAQKKFVKSLWHDASEEPDDEKEIIISMNVGTIEEECVMLIYRKENPSTLFANGCRKWCYLSDLLPKEGGEECTD